MPAVAPRPAPTVRPGPNLWWEAFLGLLLAFMLSWSWMSTSVSAPNERSRIYLAVAMVDDASLSIDGPVARFGPIYDRAERQGRLYSDKAPGSSLVGAAFYGALRQFSLASDWPIERLLQWMRHGVMLPLSLLGFFLFRRLLADLGASGRDVDLSSVGWMLGTAAFHYGQAFYGHQMVAVALVGSLWAVRRAEGLALDGRASGWDVARWATLGGTLAGLAGLVEYQAGVPGLLLTLYALCGPLGRRPGALVAFGLAAAASVAVLLAYNTLAFGGPLELSYHHLQDPALSALHTQGVGGVTLPHSQGLFGSLFSLHRGLFSTSPVFIAAVAGLVVLWRDQKKRLAMLLGATMLYFGLFMASSNVWEAGWGMGPRLLVPAMGFAMLAAGAAMARLREDLVGEVLLKSAVLFGVLYYQVMHLFFAEPPPAAANPLVDVAWPLARKGVVAPNLGQWALGLEGLWSMVPMGLAVALVALLVVHDAPRPSAMPGGPWRERWVALGCLALTTVAMWGVVAYGPTWSGKRHARFLAQVERWHGPQAPPARPWAGPEDLDSDDARQDEGPLPPPQTIAPGAAKPLANPLGVPPPIRAPLPGPSALPAR